MISFLRYQTNGMGILKNTKNPAPAQIPKGTAPKIRNRNRISLLSNYALIVEMPGIVSSRTSSRILTVSRDVKIVTPFWIAQRRIATPSS